MNKAQYAEYLETDRWKKLAKECRNKAGNRCQLCNTKDKKIAAHHRGYENLNTDLEIQDLICLCEDCHSHFHENYSLEGGWDMSKHWQAGFVKGEEKTKEKKDKHFFVRMDSGVAYELCNIISQQVEIFSGDNTYNMQFEVKLLSAILEAMAPDFNK